MQSLFLMYTQKRRPNGSVEISLSPKVRLVYLALSALLLLVLGRSLGPSHPMMIGFYVILSILVVSEDRWYFDTARSRVLRRSGLLFLARSWQLPFEEIAQVEHTGDLAQSIRDGDPINYLPGNIRPNTAALRLRLHDGKGLTLYTAAAKHRDLVRAQAETLGEAINRPVRES